MLLSEEPFELLDNLISVVTLDDLSSAISFNFLNYPSVGTLSVKFAPTHRTCDINQEFCLNAFESCYANEIRSCTEYSATANRDLNVFNLNGTHYFPYLKFSSPVTSLLYLVKNYLSAFDIATILGHVPSKDWLIDNKNFYEPLQEGEIYG